MDSCDACAFRYDDVAPRDIAAAVRTLADEYVRRLTPDPAAGPDVEHDLRWRAHPLSGVWSALEYACHVRDVLAVQWERVHQVLAEDRPSFVPMGRDERVTHDHYNDQSPEMVAMELAAAADSFAADLDSLDAAAWARTGIYSWPKREERTVTWIARHTVHEMEHHRRDIDSVLAVAAS